MFISAAKARKTYRLGMQMGMKRKAARKRVEGKRLSDFLFVLSSSEKAYFRRPNLLESHTSYAL